MRKITLLILFISLTINMAAQEITPSPAPLSKTDYRLKAKRQNTSGWILLGGGFSIATAGLIIEAKEVTEDALVTVFTLGTQEVKQTNTGEVLLIIGGAAMLGSIPCFISSSKNKRRAATATTDIRLKMETRPALVKASFIQTSFPAFTLRVHL